MDRAGARHAFGGGFGGWKVVGEPVDPVHDAPVLPLGESTFGEGGQRDESEYDDDPCAYAGQCTAETTERNTGCPDLLVKR